jgi:hypothetical protein
MSSLLRHVALVPDDNAGGQLSSSDVTRVAAALQKQVARDFGPVWDVRATVDAFATLDDVPLGYWPVLVGQEGQGGGGVHLDDNNQPYALVDLTADWTVTASHECLEMLADPFGNRLVAGDSPDPKRPGRVEFLVEVCDPCEAPGLGYTVNGVRVSDFYTPRYFEPETRAASGSGYDFMERIKKSLEVLQGGYLSWREADGTWYQEKFFGPKPVFVKLGQFDKSFRALRPWIDSLTLKDRVKMLKQRATFPAQVLVKLPGEQDNDLATQASQRRASRLRDQIKRLRAKARRTPGTRAGGK